MYCGRTNLLPPLKFFVHKVVHKLAPLAGVPATAHNVAIFR